MRILRVIVVLIFAAASLSTQSYASDDARTNATRWIDSVMAKMSLEEKVGQLIMPRVYTHYYSSSSEQFARLTRLVKNVRVGGFVMFQGDVYETATLFNALQQMSDIPLLISGDFERGLAMRVRRGTYFPDAMAVGATHNTQYAYEIGKAIADEARAIGVHQNYAPVADVNSNPENPVINTRAFSDDEHLVVEMSVALTQGMNDGNLISTAKHFPGHGDTEVDSHLHLPTLPFSRKRLDSLELFPFKKLVEGGVKSVMVGHLAVPSIDPATNVPATLSSPIINDVLKKQFGFEGLIVTDAMEMMGVMRGYSIAESSVKAIEAGVDMLLLPADEEVAISAIVAAVKSGRISQKRLEESVKKILAYKFRLGLHTQRFVNLGEIREHVATAEHLWLAKNVARDAITVLKNEGGILPLHIEPSSRVLALLISDTDDNRTDVHRPQNPWPNESAGEYLSRLMRERMGSVETVRLTPASSSDDVERAIEKAERADVLLLPVFVKVRTSSGRIGIPKNLAALVDFVNKTRKPTIVIAYGNPYNVASFPNAQALVCAYSDAEPLVEASVEAMFGEIPWRGKLPIEIRGLYPFGSGLRSRQVSLRVDGGESVGFKQEKLARLDSILVAAIRDSAFPAAQALVAKDGVIVYDKAFGAMTYDMKSREINERTMFDLASLTKVIATTSAVMKLYDGKMITLDDKVSRFFPPFSEGNKSDITIRHLLTHTSGLPPYRQLWKFVPDASNAIDSVFATALVANPGDTMMYSDLGFITLGRIVEKVSGMPLDQFVKREFFGPLGMARTMFTPSSEFRNLIAPTEYDSLWRKSLVQGTVHDENAEFLGGVSGHAGLFSTADDLAKLMQMLVNYGAYGGKRYLDSSTVALFTRKQSEKSSRALGWDTKSPTGSSAGNLFSANSFGHTGFTGTSIWADPERKLFLILLTNRVHPTRATSKIFRVRPAVADAVIEGLMP